MIPITETNIDNTPEGRAGKAPREVWEILEQQRRGQISPEEAEAAINKITEGLEDTPGYEKVGETIKETIQRQKS